MIGTSRPVGGYVTQDKYLVGRTLAELEDYLGFHAGRLARGATFVKLTQLPTEDEFELAAYSITPQHRFKGTGSLDVPRLKQMARQSWDLAGPNRLVKVIATTGHDGSMRDDDQYPPGSGVPQWRIRPGTTLPGIVVAEPKTASDIYRPVG